MRRNLSGYATVDIREVAPLVGNCLAKCIVYKPEVTTTDKRKLYHGTLDEEFKTRSNNHTNLFSTKIVQVILNFPNTTGN